MRPDKLYLRDMVDAAEAIGRFMGPAPTEAEFAADELLRAGVAWKLTELGEAAARVSPEVRSMHPEIEWSKIVGFRNILVHVYFAVSWGIVFQSATEDVPKLRHQVSHIIATWPDEDALV